MKPTAPGVTGIPLSGDEHALKPRGAHDAYGKRVLAQACKTLGVIPGSGDRLRVRYPGETGFLDGYVPPGVAVEFETRTGKQIRGAVMDLIHHDAPNKLLAIMPLYNLGPRTVETCRWILGQHVPHERFRVVLLEGNGAEPELEADAAIVAAALRELTA